MVPTASSPSLLDGLNVVEMSRICFYIFLLQCTTSHFVKLKVMHLICGLKPHVSFYVPPEVITILNINFGTLRLLLMPLLNSRGVRM